MIRLGSALRLLIWLTMVATGNRRPLPSAETHWPGLNMAAMVRGGGAPLHRWPYSLHRYDCSGPNISATFREVVVNRSVLGGAEQSSSLVTRTISNRALGRRKPALLEGSP